MDITLRNWQKEAYESFQNNNFKGILKVGTGKGKTVFAIHCIKQFLKKDKNFKTCIIVPTINLMFQWEKEIKRFLDVDVSFYYGQKKDSSGKIVIFVVNSAIINDNLRNIHLTKKFDFMIADECHHYGSNLFSKIFDFEIENRLGLSATPDRETDKEGTNKIIKGIGNKVFELNHLDDPDAIPPFVIWSILVSLTEKEILEYEERTFEVIKLNNYILSKFDISHEDEDYRKKIKELADKKEPSVLKLMSLWNKQATIKHNANNKIEAIKELVEIEKMSKIIIFNERISFVEKLYEELNKKRELNLFLVHSKLSKQNIQKTLDDFKECKEGILIAPRLIDEGYNVPDASVSIIASFTKSARQMIQRDGRILRKTDNKKVATRYSLIIENIEEIKYFQVLNASDMGGKALEGEWLKFDEKQKSFFNNVNFKNLFINFDEIKSYHKDQFKSWVIKRLDYYENKFKKDITEIEKRIEFFTRFMDIIELLLNEYPNKWKILRTKLKKRTMNKKVKFNNNTSVKDRNILKEELRSINSVVLLPDELFSIIMRAIDNEPFELNELLKDFVINLTEGEKPNIWTEKIYNFIKYKIRNNIN